MMSVGDLIVQFLLADNIIRFSWHERHNMSELAIEDAAKLLLHFFAHLSDN